jgi:hypothetical protein
LPNPRLRTFDQLFATQQPKTLYHYTRRAGLLGILSDRAIWASSARHLNDAHELEVGLEALVQVARELSETQDDHLAGLLEAVNMHVPIAREELDAFVFSLSTDPDELSQCDPTVRPCMFVLPTLKHPQFERESEWRLIHRATIWDKAVQFRDGGKLVVPYLPLRFERRGSTSDHSRAGRSITPSTA